MKRNKNDKQGNGFWWLVLIMCTYFGGIHLVDMWPYGCFIFLIGIYHLLKKLNLKVINEERNETCSHEWLLDAEKNVM